MIEVVWATWQPDTIARRYWDQQIIEDLAAGRPHAPGWEPARHYTGFDLLPAGTQGAVVVVPARHNVGHVAELQAALDRFDSYVLVLTGDEERTFDLAALDLSRAAAVWQQDPRLDAADQTPHGAPVRWLGSGYTPHTKLLAGSDRHAEDRQNRWVFAGQVTHDRRRQAADVLRRMAHGELVETEAFTSGLPPAEYLAQLASAMVAPAPSGPKCPDSFRFYEALEAGCVPIPDGVAGGVDQSAHWRQVCWGDDHPFTIIDDWRRLPDLVRKAADSWPTWANRCGSWWSQHRRRLAYCWALDTGQWMTERAQMLDDMLTVVVTVSPTAEHPSTATIEETIGSVVERAPGCPILVVCDGVRPEQAQYADRYEQHIARLLWLARWEWPNTTVIRSHEWLHQAGQLRRLLEAGPAERLLPQVSSPAILFVEHDTPLIGDVPLAAITARVVRGDYDVVRLHHEASILEPHRHLMVGNGPDRDPAAPVWPTVQWSQRPHVASTDYYRDIMATHFTTESRTMIEDTMHSVVQRAGWRRHRLGIYHPVPDEHGIKRSTHLDARGDDPKYPMRP